MYQLYYYPGNASVAVHMMLETLAQKQSIDYELILVDREVNAQKSLEYMKLNPTGRIPTLVDTTFTNNDEPLAIFESSAICLHLLEQHPQCGLIPEISSPLRSQFYQWLMYINNTVQAELMLYFYPEKYTTDIASCTSIIEMAERRVTKMFRLLDSQLENNKFLIGDTLSVCDFFLFMVSNWASAFVDAPLSMPNLSRYLKMMASLPAIEHAFKKEERSLHIYQ